MPIASKHSFGWVPDVPDQRDRLYAAPVLAPRQQLPAQVDLRPTCPPTVYDQGQLGSCTANAIAAAIEFDQIKQGQTPRTPSRLFIYYNEREMEHTVNTDSGAQIRDGIKSVAKLGACVEGNIGDPPPAWPYDISKFTQKPPARCYQDAKEHCVQSYQRVARTLNQMRGCLASGFPFVFGFSVYESFESDTVASTGIVPMPAPHEVLLGGHAVLAVGYDDQSQRFIVRNSWGDTWGDKGCFYMPYAYLLDGNLADDFWTIRLIA